MKPNSKSKSLETAKRNGNEMLKYSTSTLPCKPHCIRQQEELQVQHDSSAQVQIPVNNYETSHEVTETKDDTDLTSYRPVLDLLHARRVSPLVLTHKPAQSARYPDSLTSFAPSVRKSANVLTTSKAAFTLAEVLITLAIIGVVAVLTLPALIQNYNTKAWETAQDVFTKRLEVATRQMNTEEKLAGYSNTMDFVNELKRYIKITRVCDNSNITKCFNKEVIWNEGEDPIDMSTIKNAASLGQEDWDTDTVAVQFANGVNAIIAYNPNTTQEPFNNQFSATSNSMAILYDVSGNKNPNTNGKDIGKINVENLAGVTGCMIPELADTMCITQILAPDTGYSPMTYAECTEAKDKGEIDVQYCYNGNDYWAGAVAKCGGVSNMPSQEQLTQLANYIYNTDSVSSSGTTNSLAMDTEKASQFLSASPYSNYFYVWSGQEYSQYYAYLRGFNSTNTYWHSYYRHYSNRLAVCLGDSN